MKSQNMNVSKGDIDALVEKNNNKYDILSEGRDPEEFKRHVAVQAGKYDEESYSFR